MTRRQQHMSQDSPSQGSTPAEMAEDEVNKLSVEVMGYLSLMWVWFEVMFI